MTEHTPTPWTLTPEPHASWIGSIGNNSNDPQLWSVATPFPKGDKHADAAFIVKAVNNHDALVNALRNARNYIDAVVANTPDKKKRRNYSECLLIIEDALRPVGGNSFAGDALPAHVSPQKEPS